MDIYTLASAINDFWDYWDPFGYRDAFGEKEDGLNAYINLLRTSPKSAIDELMDIFNEFKEEKALILAKEIKQGGFYNEYKRINERIRRIQAD